MSSRKFGLNLVVVLAIAALFTGFWALINRPVSAPNWPEQISGFSYSPFQQGQYPQKDQYPTDDEMRRDLEIISKLTDNIRTYSVDGTLGDIPKLAEEFGLRVTIGIWISPDLERNEREIQKAIELANKAYIERGGEPEAYGTNSYEEGTCKGVSWPREPEDVTGGFLFELEYTDRYAEEASGVVTQRGQPVVVKEPEEMSAAQGEYVNALLNSFERAIFASDGVDSETGRHYTEIADFNSLVRKYMIEEVCKNYDGNKSSQYFFKDSDAVDPLLYAGPVWDYDSAWGNYAREGVMSAAEPKRLSIARQGYDYSWWPALYKHEEFRHAVRVVYEQELRPLLEVLTGARETQEDGEVKSLDAYAQELSASAEMNFVRWRVLNHSTRVIKTGATYEANVNYLKNWIEERMEYLDKNW